MEKTIIYGLEDLNTVIDFLYSKMAECRIFTFTGSLGVGKTTLVRALLKKCEITDLITSPTFTYVNKYKDEQGQTFYHFDCYRLKKAEDFVALGFDEYLQQPNSWVFIEWPEVIESLLPKDVYRVTLEYKGQEQRIMNCTWGNRE